MRRILRILPWVALAEGVGGLSAWLTRDGMAELDALRQPPLTPPRAVFPVVWAALYALMGWGAARVAAAASGRARARALTAFFCQLGANALWTVLFFGLGWRGTALLWLMVLWGLILWMVRSFAEVDPLAGRLQLPYLLWVTFAGYLNLGLWWLNR